MTTRTSEKDMHLSSIKHSLGYYADACWPLQFCQDGAPLITSPPSWSSDAAEKLLAQVTGNDDVLALQAKMHHGMIILPWPRCSLNPKLSIVNPKL